MSDQLEIRIALAREARIDSELDMFLEDKLSKIELSAKTVSPAALKKLKPLIKFYAKKAKPFTACVRDNRKRFGPLTEKYCAVIVDLIHGGDTHWRNGGGKGKGSSIALADDQLPPQIDEEVVALLDALPEVDRKRLDQIYMEAIEVTAS